MISLGGGRLGFLDRERTCVLSLLGFFREFLGDFEVSVSEEVRDIVSSSRVACRRRGGLDVGKGSARVGSIVVLRVRVTGMVEKKRSKKGQRLYSGYPSNGKAKAQWLTICGSRQ